MSSSSIKTNYPALYTLVTVFFFWGFFAAGNSIFIPFCKAFFHLDQFQSQLIDFSFYTAYYLGALILFLISSYRQKDVVSSWGFKRSIVYGLLFSTIGAAAMIWAVEVSVYVALLVGLFVVALGFSLQQIAANPLAIALGDPKTGTSRVSLGGGINSLGTTIGPLLMAYALFGTTKSLTDDQIQHLSLDKMVFLYAAVGGLFLLAAAMFYFSKKIPEGISNEKIEPAKKAIRLLLVMTALLIALFIPVFSSYNSEDFLKVESLELEYKEIASKAESEQLSVEAVSEQLDRLHNQIVELKEPIENKRIMLLSGVLLVISGSVLLAYFKSRKSKEGWGAMQYPQLLLGMLGIFAYVGVEVGIGSNLGELLKLEEFGSLQSSEIAPYLSMYWGSLMIGRWAGAVSVFNLDKSKRLFALIVVPFVAYGVVLLANKMAGNEIEHLYYYSICVAIQVLFSFWSKNKSARTMILFSLFGLVSMIVGLFSSGMIAVYAFLAGGLACSVLWPAIFNISIMGLGKYTAQGSSFLIMMILGGGIIPPIQGKVADIIGIHQSYIVCVMCFVYLLAFGLIAKRVLKEQNIEIDRIE
ncbi:MULTISPECIES: MFS transporter [Myroides]|uniref:MFS transporter n=1 Tax=Myroides albus TaxID=2562892 RepID=A0A6I3LJ52_9FLAO|nr:MULTISPECIES: MFS transporter [Myroides]MTG97844.1 MFS transporter [Myroides albus]MVX35966.1 MFS transporter [Myroides sp. LoEW2-1]UVD79801.1 MFS transporter [Myroides albus]